MLLTAATLLAAPAVNSQQNTPATKPAEPAASFTPTAAAPAPGRPTPEGLALLAGDANAEPALLTLLTAEVSDAFDSSRGGWVGKNGIPFESAVELGFDLARSNGELWKSRALYTMNWTWALYDSVGGGFFHRLANIKKDDTSFEKRTLSNARRLENLADAWNATHDPLYRARATAVAEYFNRVLLDGRGGFIDGQVGSRDLVPQSNGLAIHAWLVWAAASTDRGRFNFALRSLDRAWEETWHPDLGMLHKDLFGTLKKAPQLDDQVEMGRAYVLGAHLGGRPVDLEHAKTIATLLETNFLDPKRGTWRTQAVPQKSGKVRSAVSISDENARAALFMAELASVSGEERWREAARRSLHASQAEFARSGLYAADWALAVRALNGSDFPSRPEWPAAEQTKPKPSNRFR